MIRKPLAPALVVALVVAALLALSAAPAWAIAPDAPPQPTLTSGDAQITVTFGPPASDGGSPITVYTADCTSSDSGTPGTNTGATSPIVVSSLENGHTYTCTVTATNTDGTSAPSPASDPAVPSTVPDAPPQPTVTSGDAQITVTFSPPASDGGSPITLYTADCTSSDSGTPGTNTGATSPIVVSSLDNGHTYTCTVTATNTDGAGSPSPASGPAVPRTFAGAPSLVSVAAGNAQITIAFTSPASNGGSPITTYTASCTSSNGGAARFSGSASSPITVAGVTNGRTYRCSVRAVNGAGAGPASAASAAVVPSTVPNRPAPPTATAGDARISVSFAAPPNGGSAITGYTASCTSSDGGAARSTNSTTSPIVVTGATNAKTYTCTVVARNKNGSSLRSSASSAVVPRGVAHGYRLFSGDGGVFTFGSARYYGSASGRSFARVIGMASTPSGNGYWLVNTLGQVFAFGDAHFYGQPSHLNRPVVGISATPTGHGYWLVATDGGIFAYGDAHFFGSTGGLRLVQPIVAMAPTPSGNGYWLSAGDGGIFTFGDAHFHGSVAGSANQPIVGIAPDVTGGGYWLVGANGGVYRFGDAPNLGGVSVSHLRLPIRGIASTPTGRGYWLAAGDGGVFSFGDAPWFGWPGPIRLMQTIRGVAR